MEILNITDINNLICKINLNEWIKAGNIETGEWDDIAPIILFMAVNNVYSIAFSLYIPSDMSFVTFAGRIVDSVKNGTEFYFNGAEFIDMEYLNKMGKYPLLGSGTLM